MRSALRTCIAVAHRQHMQCRHEDISNTLALLDHTVPLSACRSAAALAMTHLLALLSASIAAFAAWHTRHGFLRPLVVATYSPILEVSRACIPFESMAMPDGAERAHPSIATLGSIWRDAALAALSLTSDINLSHTAFFSFNASFPIAISRLLPAEVVDCYVHPQSIAAGTVKPCICLSRHPQFAQPPL